jgi:hypothetical protein
MIDYTGLRDGLLATFGEQVTVTVGGVESPLTAAWLAPHVGMDLGVPVNRPDPQIVARAEDWDEIEAQNGDSITRNGVVLTIADVQPDDDGMVTVTLRRYTS